MHVQKADIELPGKIKLVIWLLDQRVVAESRSFSKVYERSHKL
jgi:hypothetical protein